MIHTDDKLNTKKQYPINCCRRRKPEAELNAFNRTAFLSVNASVSGLGSTALTLRAFYTFHLQQKLPLLCVSAIVSQVNALKLLKRYGTATHYPRTPAKYDTRTISFADASHSQENSQL